MIPKDNDFDPEFPGMFYRMGKYVNTDEAQLQEQREHYSKRIYEMCLGRGEETLGCYKQKCYIIQALINTSRSLV